MADIFQLSLAALSCCNVASKIDRINSLTELVNQGGFDTQTDSAVKPVTEPGRPVLPIHVHPSEVKRRRLGSVDGRVALIHAIAHIEFNAMNLALDAVYRFRGMPEDYYRDWMRVASEESSHFMLLSNRLNELSSCYGTLPVHGGMWAMAVESQCSTNLPKLKMKKRWLFLPVFLQKRLNMSESETAGLKHGRAALRGPFNKPARLKAGFSEAELDELDAIEKLFKEEARSV